MIADSAQHQWSLTTFVPLGLVDYQVLWPSQKYVSHFPLWRRFVIAHSHPSQQQEHDLNNPCASNL